MTDNMKSASPVPASAPRERLEWLDALKGLGIILVVIGHNQLIPWESWINTAIYSFHMPLFFALGAVSLHKVDFAQLIERTCSLLWVYFSIGILVIGVAVLSPRTGAALSDSWPAWHAFQGLVYGAVATIRNGPMWFLPCYALTQLCAGSILILLRNAPYASGKRWPILVLALTIIFLGERLMSPVPRPQLPWRLDWGSVAESGYFWTVIAVPLGVGFSLYGCWIFNQLKTTATVFHLAISLLILTGYLLLLPFIKGTDYHAVACGVWGPYWIASLAALAAITGLFFLFRSLGTFLPLSLIGQATLPILIIHGVLQRKTSAILDGYLSSWLAILISISISIFVPYALDRLLKNRLVWQFFFYPRKFIKNVQIYSATKDTRPLSA